MKQKMTKAELIEALDAAEARIAKLEASSADDALRESEERLRLSLSASRQGVFDVNLLTGETIVNHEYAEMLGYDLETFDASSQAWEQRLHPEERADVTKALEDYLNGKIPEYQREFRLRTSDGSWKWIQAYGRIMEKDLDGKPLRLLGTHTDITNQKQAQVEVQKRAAQLTMINDVGRQITGVLDLQGVFNSSARLIRESFGHHHVGLFMFNEAEGQLEMKANAGQYSALFPSTHHIRLGEGVVGSVGMSGQMLLANKVEQDTRYKNFIPSILPTRSELALPIKVMGKLKGVLDVQSPQPDAFNEDDIKVLETLADQIAVAVENARLYEAIHKELAERKQAEEKNRMLTIALESAANSILITDSAGTIQWVNTAWCAQTGYFAQEIIGKNPRIMSSGAHEKSFYKEMWDVILSGKTWSGETINKRKDGTLYTEETTITPVHDEHDRIINFIAIKQDITGRKAAQKERQKLIRNLGDRVKELTALHQAARLLQAPSINEADAMQALVNILPPALQYPEVAAARITSGDQHFTTAGFMETPWMLGTSFKLPNGETGEIVVAYLEERPDEVFGPFLAEEQDMLETLAERLQSAMTRLSMERDLRRQAETLSNLVEAGNALSETLNLKYIYAIVQRYISAAMPCDFLILSSFNRQSELITCEYLHSSEGPQDVSHFPSIPLEPPGQGTQSRVVRSGESLLLPDYQMAVKTASASVHFDENAQIVESPSEDDDIPRSAIIVPLRVNGLVAGALQVHSTTLNAHTQENLQFVETLAFHVSAALSNAKLISELEERVQARTAEVQDLYDNAPVGYHTLDAENRIITINQTEAKWLGYTPEEMLGRDLLNFLTPESQGIYEGALPIFKKRGSLNGLELEFLRKDGSSFPVLVNAVAIMDEFGNYLMRRSAVFDNSERRKAENALQQSEETYRALFENANDAIFLFDAHGAVLQANPNCYNLLGITSDKMIRRNMNEFIHPSELENSRAKKQKLLSGEHLLPYESRMLRFDGNMIEVEINLSLVRDVNGEPKFIQSAIRNISERKEAENAQRESEEQNRLLFEEAPEALVLFDQNGRVIRINHAFETITGIAAGQITGNMIMQLGILPRDLMNALTASQIDPFEHRHNSASLEFKLNHASGEERYISTRIFVLNLRGGLHYLASMYDITVRKQAEETLRFANAEMERALRLKDEFLANMSHELRTPLNAILGISESLLEQVSGPLNEKQSKYLQTVLESGQHLLELINDILDLAKINAGRINLEVHKVSIEGVAQSSLRMIRQLAFKNEQQVVLEIDENCKTIVADERRLKQMLVNLLGNAVKFTAKGGQLGLQVRGDMENQIMQFTIWDTGIGIKEKDLPHLFQPFIQLDAGLARSSQGTGLGLALVSQMARLHGGSVTVESKPGAGSRFTINLPWEQNQAPVLIVEPNAETSTSQQNDPSIMKKENQTILLVEDTEALSAMLQDYLKIHGYEVIIARDGLEGVEQARATPPDLILMDVMMPEMDGYESTRRIRADLGLTHVPIIALTALAMAGDRERCLAAGMNDYISKPIKLTDLLKIIEKHIESRKGEP